MTAIRMRQDQSGARSVFPESRLIDDWSSNLFGLPKAMDFQLFNPALDVRQEGNMTTLTLEVPGIDKESIAVDIVGNQLNISGEKDYEDVQDREGFIRRERRFGKFSRRIEIPEGTDIDKITAEIDQGILTVRLPGTKETQKRKVEIVEKAKSFLNRFATKSKDESDQRD